MTTVFEMNDLEVVFYMEEMKNKGFKCECSVVKDWLVKSSTLFKPQCCIHDLAYQTAGNSSDRKRADYGFYKRCISGCIDLDNRKLVFYLTVATVWFCAVRMFGWSAFKYGAYKTDAEILEENAFKYSATWKQRANKKFNEWLGIKWD